jgi:tRNA dimethylallyltransferase
MDKIICVVGPTASGKTALAIELAKEYNGEVVSCDSMYVYRGMNIGTAKPTEAEMQSIVHHMIDVCEPTEDFSVSRYTEMATPIVDEILARGKTAIIAGGTGLYADSLIRGNDFAPIPATGYREKLEQEIEEVKGFFAPDRCTHTIFNWKD